MSKTMAGASAANLSMRTSIIDRRPERQHYISYERKQSGIASTSTSLWNSWGKNIPENVPVFDLRPEGVR
jgi:hypothetical protein